MTTDQLLRASRRYGLPITDDGHGLQIAGGRIVACPDGCLAFTSNELSDSTRHLARSGFGLTLFCKSYGFTFTFKERRLPDVIEMLKPEPQEEAWDRNPYRGGYRS